MSKKDRGLEIMFYQVNPQPIPQRRGFDIDKKFKILNKIINFKFHLSIS